ncbi:serine protease inhibitor A6-like isoform X1 [Rana temporaria]|uniref:serine protease inhibitor A6-like isoform X1 n=1 Tax=Rana temporaria TaxID=8407 RepID=UPI001AAD5F09|nr:serine protease inhibitor A6-like isoform X1 [Rana temporaria]XP_040188968.1 serine protease inhibitor A6-like isoform X1 [Rana temporaria]
MKFLLVSLLLIPVITSSDDHKPEESHEGAEGVKGNTEFAFDFFKHLTSMSSRCKDSPPKNIVLSPFSISSALSMLLLGAQSKTHQEILEGLSLNNTNLPESEIHRAYSTLLHLLNEPKSSLQVDIGNALFVEQTLTLLKSFEDDLKNFYHAEIRKTNFNDPQEAKKEVNEYVKDKTEGKIEELIEEFSADTRLALINYVLFKGEWQYTFRISFTSKFKVDKNTTVDVQMMLRTGRYNIFRDTELPCTVVELPYKDDASMIIAMAEPGKIREVERGMSSEAVQRWRTSWRETLIDLYVPKFKITSKIDLVDELSKVGIVTPFTDAADFSGIIPDFRLKVGSAVHQAVINVDKEGTVAAAATGVGLCGAALNTPLPLPIVIDKPFVFFIIEQKTDSLLFMGTVANPTEE